MSLSSTKIIATFNNLGVKEPPMSVGEKVRALRAEKGWSQEDLAKKAGISQPAIRKIESGQTKKSKYLPNIANAFGVNIAVLDPTLGDGPQIALTPAEALTGERNLPVYGSTEGGEGAIILSVDAVDYVRRPAPLANVRDGYGLIVTGDSMEPEFRPGDTALVHPHLPPIPGEACVFYSDDGHGNMKATIKVFLKSTELGWQVEQWNPAKRFTLAKKEWQKAHRVVGKYSRR